jgi:hypothetical protein
MIKSIHVIILFALQTEASKAASSAASELGLANVGGVFVVLMGGMGVAIIMALCEFIWKSRKLAMEEHASLCTEMGKELQFALKCRGSTKPTPKHIQKSSSSATLARQQSRKQQQEVQRQRSAEQQQALLLTRQGTMDYDDADDELLSNVLGGDVVVAETRLDSRGPAAPGSEVGSRRGTGSVVEPSAAAAARAATHHLTMAQQQQQQPSSASTIGAGPAGPGGTGWRPDAGSQPFLRQQTAPSTLFQQQQTPGEYVLSTVKDHL